MKAPSLKLNPAAIGDFFLSHGEKFVVAIVGLMALLVAWGGLDAMRLRSITTDRRPEVIVREASQAEENIGREKTVPPDKIVSTTSLVTGLEPWRSPRPQDPPSLAMFDRPLFDAATKRTQPDVFPIEDLRVTAGVAVMRQPMVPGGDLGFPGVAAPPGFPPPGFPGPGAPGGGEQAGETARRGGKGRREKGQPAGSEAMAMAPDMGMMAAATGMPRERVRAVPYAIVTGLIPARKQFDEYMKRFANASFQDPRRDTPLWSDFEIDRCVVGAGGPEDWVTLDLQQVFTKQSAEWPGLAADVVPPFFMLSPDEEMRRGRSAPLPFCGPLPQRVDANWGDEAQHPWIKKSLQILIDQQAAAAKAAAAAAQNQDQSAVDVFQGQGGGFGAPGFGGPGYGGGSMPGGGMMPGMMSEPGMMSGMMPGTMMESGVMGAGMGVTPNAMAQRPEYRLFRFVDTTVEPGMRYRYRVRLKAWNPNWSPTPEQMRPHVADFSVTKEQKLVSPLSAESSMVRVPELTSLLLAMLPEADRKRMRLKPGMFEILVMAITDKTGNYSLRSVLADVGGIANVDAKTNRPGDLRSRGDDVATNMLLVDAIGEQSDAADLPAARRPKGPQEPLEMLFVREDGTFEAVTAADSQTRFVRYRQTLPDTDDTRRGVAPTPNDGMIGSPEFVSPFGQISQ